MPCCGTDGLSCAGCHVRKWVRRGPPNVAPSLLAIPGYPLVTTGLYERADVCHAVSSAAAAQRRRRPAVARHLSRVARGVHTCGVACNASNCHMPNREHAFLGIHDAHTFRQGIELTARRASQGRRGHHRRDIEEHRRGSLLADDAPRPRRGCRSTYSTHMAVRSRVPTAHSGIGRDIWFDGTWQRGAPTRGSHRARRLTLGACVDRRARTAEATTGADLDRGPSRRFLRGLLHVQARRQARARPAHACTSRPSLARARLLLCLPRRAMSRFDSAARTTSAKTAIYAIRTPLRPRHPRPMMIADDPRLPLRAIAAYGRHGARAGPESSAAAAAR